MPIVRQVVDSSKFNAALKLPYSLRAKDFEMAMQDIYDFFHDVNNLLSSKGLRRLDDMLRPAGMSGLISDMLTESVAKHSRTLVQNEYHNGHPDLVVQGKYPNNAAKAGSEGVEIKTTRKPGGAVDTHGARNQWMCSFVYTLDNETQPVVNRAAMAFTEVYIAQVVESDFRKNDRGERGTRTATLDRAGLVKLRAHWLYLAT